MEEKDRDIIIVWYNKFYNISYKNKLYDMRSIL